MKRLSPRLAGACALLLAGLPPLMGHGALQRVDLSAPERALVALLVWWVTPVILWLLALRPSNSETGLSFFARALATGVLHGLLALTLFAIWDPGYESGAWVFGISFLIPAALLFRAPPILAKPRRWSRSMVPMVGIAAALAVWMAVSPTQIDLWTDAPAHLGAIHDALQEQAWTPPDLSFSSSADRPDPRFGVLHGFYAAVVSWSASEPIDVLRAAPIVLSPLWFFAHAWWFSRWGLSPTWALLVSGLFTVAGAGGRGFGLWSVSYPGNVAIAISTLGFGCLWSRPFESAASWRPERSWWVGVLLIALSVRVHPFAWWMITFVLLQATLLLALLPRVRAFAPRVGLSAVIVLAAGVILLIPSLASRSISAAGLHQMPVQVVMFDSGLFVVDPFWIMRWGGASALAVAPLLLLLGRSWWSTPRRVVAGSAALVVWTLSLNPLLAPIAWKAVSYLVVRTGRFIHTSWWWVTIAREGWRRARSSESGILGRAAGGLAALVCIALLVGQLDLAVRLILEKPSSGATSDLRRLEAMANAVRRTPDGRAIADPRVSYGIRALIGGTMPVMPVAHSSPLDLELPERLRGYRQLMAPAIDPTAWVDTVERLGCDQFLVDLAPARLSGKGEFGFVPSSRGAALLQDRLRMAGGRTIDEGESWVLFDVSELSEVGMSDSSDSSEVVGRISDGETSIGHGSRFKVVHTSIDCDTAVPGQICSVRMVYRAREGPDVTATPGWERVELRFVGPMPTVPGWMRGFSKPYRKLFVERSGRSKARFGTEWTPYDGTWPPEHWSGAVSERREIQIPEQLKPGPYRVELRIREAPWYPRRHISDFLTDEDRQAGVEVDDLLIVTPGGT